MTSNTISATSLSTCLNEQLIDACSKQDSFIVQKLLSEGAQADFLLKKDGTWGAYEQYSALHLAILGLPDSATTEQEAIWKEIIQILLKNGANPNATKESYDWRGCGGKQTAFQLLSCRTRSPDAQLLAAFLEAGLSPNLAQTQDIASMRTDGFIKTHLLHDFARSGSIDCAIAILNAGADVDIRAIESTQNERGFREERSETSLHVAVCNHQIEMCILLLAKGADINAINYRLDAVVLKEIADKNTTDDPRDEAYMNPWKITPIECTSLHMAIKEKKLDLAIFLLITGADPNIPYKRIGEGSISTLDLCKCEKLVSPFLLEALADKPDTEKGVEALPLEVQDKISKAFDKIQDEGWNINTNNFSDIQRFLKS